MKKNMGSIDKGIRIAIAILIAVLAYAKVFTGIWAVILLALAVIFVVTSFISFCPLYWPFGISTARKKE
jgi:hypothetical protein